MEHRYLLCRFLVLCLVISLILFLNSQLEQGQVRITKLNESRLIFNDHNSWNVKINSLIDMNIEADVTISMEYLSQFQQQQQTIYKARTYFIMKMNNLFIIIWKMSSMNKNSKEYLYLEALNWKYERISYEWNITNQRIISIPSILSIDQLTLTKDNNNQLNSHVIINQHGQPIFILNSIEKQQIKFFNLFTSHQSSLSIKNNLILNKTMNWIPLTINDQFYFIDSLKPFKFFNCHFNKSKCELSSKSERTLFFRDATQFVRYDETNYFLGIISLSVSCSDCSRMARPHLMILLNEFDRFQLIYLSEPLEFDRLPMLNPFSMSEQVNSTNYCYGIIREIIPELIINWDFPYNKLLFTLSINSKQTFLVSLNRIGIFVRSIINSQKTKYTNEQIISFGQFTASNYCSHLSQISKFKSNKSLIEKDKLRQIYVNDTIQSPTYPTFSLVSNTDRRNLIAWIDYDSINYGLIGRYLTEFNSMNRVHGLMIDAGGNHGMYSFYAAMFNQTVHVFEILPKYWIVIEESIRMNKQIGERIHVHKCGISDRFGQWNILPDDGTTRLTFQQNSTQNQIIEAFPLDEFIFQRVSLMKIDVESFEIRALKGAFRAIRLFGVGAILIEIAPSRWLWNNITLYDGITTLEYVTSIGYYSNYIILRHDSACPFANLSTVNEFTPISNLTMLNMTDGHRQITPYVYQFSHWTTIIALMNIHQWNCNFWLENHHRTNN